MFSNTTAFNSFAVDDIDAARSFYGDTLGVTVSDGPMGVLSLDLAGGRSTMIYPKPDFTPATYTVLNFRVEDIEAAVDGLRERGVEFERYDDSFEQDDRGIARAAGPAIAWFKDPAGNILSVLRD
jgi:predicted enzyme related to lactoylglutathione lyase